MASLRWVLVGALLFVGCPDGRVRVDATGSPDAVLPSIDTGTRCGNGIVEEGEDCEGSNLAGESCTSQGYAGGSLSCRSDCTFDKSGCTESACGNGRIEGTEACDGSNLGSASCESLGFESGELRCSPTCTYDRSACSLCGNGIVDSGEECDGAAFGSMSCVTRGYSAGTLACSACAIDESGCLDAGCGNGVVDPGEDCDGALLGGASCMSRGYVGGTLRCNTASCTFDTSMCSACGDGNIDAGEQCDGSDLGGQTCLSRGFTRGTLRCTSACRFDTGMCETTVCGNGLLDAGETCDDGNALDGDGCTMCRADAGYTCTGSPSTCRPTCGDGMIVGAEQCDGTNLNSATCLSRGFTMGTLACSATTCRFDESGCFTPGCGNGRLEAGEECDDGNRADFDGCDGSCQVDANFNLPVRLVGGDGSNHGRVEVHFAGTWRDVCDDTVGGAAAQQAFANVVCRQLGYTGTGHMFISEFGGGTGTPLMDDLACTGTEPNLSQCGFAGWNTENCTATEAVGVRCVPAQGDVRLVGGTSGMEGRLQVFNAGAWGEVCDDGFESATYRGYSILTACQQLGYRTGPFVGTWDAPSDVFALDDLRCSGTERRIADCPHAAWGVENCTRDEATGTRCELYRDGDARLVGGTARNRGRIEVLHGSVWGTVCDDGLFSAGSAQTQFLSVACRNMLYTPATGSLIDPTDGTDPIWLDELMCSGTETSLAMCRSNGWGTHNCFHGEDVGVVCNP